MMRPEKIKVEPSSSKNDCLNSEIKRFKAGESSQGHIGSWNENDPSQTDDSGNSHISAMMVAMDNHLILKEIFKYLSPPDQRICCEVSEEWRAIAGPMIFEYHLKVEFNVGIKAKITKGYLNPQITLRNFSTEGEIEYPEILKYKNSFLSLEFVGFGWDFEFHQLIHRDCPLYQDDIFHRARDFVKKFRTQVFKLKCSHYSNIYKFFLDPSKRDNIQMLPDFPNCEEYHESSTSSIDWCSEMKFPCPMNQLRKVYLGHFYGQLNRNDILAESPKVLEMIPNLQEIHRVPFPLIGQFERAKKLHLVQSIRFYRVDSDSVDLETEAFKAMVEFGFKFKFLRFRGDAPERLMKRTKLHFDELLKIGKDTLEHLVLHESKYGPLIDIPARMSALTHITLTSHYWDALNFPTGFNFSEYFPKLTTISFKPMTISQWKSGGSWWKTKGVPGWEEFRKGIRHLRCDGPLSGTVQKNLLRKFPSVSRIEFVRMYHSDADGFVYK